MVWLRLIMAQPFTFILGSRQIGKTMFVARFIAWQLISQPGQEWTCLSATRDHAVKLAREIRANIKLFIANRKRYGRAHPDFKVDNQQEIILSNGSYVQVRAATVRGVVGSRGNVLFDEIGVVPEQEACFEAVYPIVRARVDNDRLHNRASSGRMIVMSNATPKGTWWEGAYMGGQHKEFQRITAKWTDCMSAIGWTAQMLQEGMSRIVDSIGAPGYQQWYDCDFRAAGGSYFSAEMLNAATVDGYPATMHQNGISSVGYDIGRHKDPTALVPIFELYTRISKTRYARRGKLIYDTPYREQRDMLRTMVEGLPFPCRKIVVDRTGAGDETAEECRRMFGGYVEGFLFGEATKWGLFSNLRDDIDSGMLKLDRGDLDMRMHLESVTTKTNKSGKVAISTPRSGNHHCDLAIGLGLANHGLRG